MRCFVVPLGAARHRKAMQRVRCERSFRQQQIEPSTSEFHTRLLHRGLVSRTCAHTTGLLSSQIKMSFLPCACGYIRLACAHGDNSVDNNVPVSASVSYNRKPTTPTPPLSAMQGAACKSRRTKTLSLSGVTARATLDRRPALRCKLAP